MGNKTVIYKQKVKDNLTESFIHLERLKGAFDALKEQYSFPISNDNFCEIKANNQYLAYSDQIIYRFSKLQDCIGAKLFKSVLFYQGENVNKPFLDILNQLEYMNIIDVDEWFEIRDLRNEIAHNYENNDNVAKGLLNMIYRIKDELKKILINIEELIKEKEKNV